MPQIYDYEIDLAYQEWLEETSGSNDCLDESLAYTIWGIMPIGEWCDTVTVPAE